MKEEVMKKFEAASTVEELLSLAKEENIELSQEEAESLLSSIKDASCELDDSELDNVSGGASVTIGSHKYQVVTSHYCCEYWRENTYLDSNGKLKFYVNDNPGLRKVWYDVAGKWYRCCGACKYLQFKGATGICDIPID